jgi:hypothetical protein
VLVTRKLRIGRSSVYRAMRGRGIYHPTAA